MCADVLHRVVPRAWWLTGVLLFILSAGTIQVHGQAAEPVIPVQGFAVTGGTVFDAAELEALLADDVGSRTLGQLEQAAGKITAMYRQSGYPLAQAYIPAQELGEDGIVRIAVVEGRFGQIRLENSSRLRDEAALKLLAGLRPNDVVQSARLVRAVRLLEETPGVRVRSELSSGAEVGTSDMIVHLTDGTRSAGMVTVANEGSGSDTPLRTTMSIGWRNVSGAGDRLDAQVATTGAEMLSVQATYDVPAGDDGFRAGLALSHSRNESALTGGAGVKVQRDGVDVSWRYPRLRAEAGSGPGLRQERVDWNAAVLWRRTVTEVAGVVMTEDQVQAMVLGIESTGRLGGHPVSGAFTLTLGHTLIHDPWAPDDDFSSIGAGNFAKLNGSVRYERAWRHGVWLRTVLRGQLASRNLHASEQFRVSGTQGVRAYAASNVSGDHGLVLQMEAGRSLGIAGLVGTVFLDAGVVQVEHTPPGTVKTVRTVAGAGVGISAVLGRGFEVEMRYAVPLSAADEPAYGFGQVRWRW